MIPHPQTISAISDGYHLDVLTSAARERLATSARTGRGRGPRVAGAWLSLASAAVLFALIWLVATASATASRAPDDGMPTAEEAANLEIARRFFTELHDRGDLAVASEIVAPDAVFHLPSGDLTGPEGISGLVTSLRTAFPDATFPIEEIVADGEIVAVRWVMRGASHGAFQGIPPTGEAVELRGTAFLRIADGRIVEDWVTYDQLGLLQQLGAAPTAPADRHCVARSKAESVCT